MCRTRLRLLLSAQLLLAAAPLSAQQAPEPPAPELAESPPPAQSPKSASAQTPQQSPAPVEPLPAEGGARDRLVSPWVVIAAGGVLLVSGSVVGLIAADKVNTIQDACPAPQNVCPPDYDLEGAKSDVQPLLITADALLISGIVVAGFGSLFAIIDALEDSPQPAATASKLPDIACGADGCMATVRGKF